MAKKSIVVNGAMLHVPAGITYRASVSGMMRDPEPVTLDLVYVVDVKTRNYLGIMSNGEIFELKKKFKMTKADLENWTPVEVKPLPATPHPASDTRMLEVFGNLVVCMNCSKKIQSDGGYLMVIDGRSKPGELIGQAESPEAAARYVQDHATAARLFSQKQEYGLTYGEMRQIPGLMGSYGPHYQFADHDVSYTGKVICSGSKGVIQQVGESFVYHGDYFFRNAPQPKIGGVVTLLHPSRQAAAA